MRKSKLPPGPKTNLPLGHFFDFRRDSIGFLKKIANDYGDIVHFKIGPLRIVLLNHPKFIQEVLSKQHKNFIKGRPLEMAKEILGEGLLTSEGDLHKRQSRIIQPAFHRNMIESYASAMTDCAVKLMNRWEDGMQIDMMVEMTMMSTEIAGKALFNADLENEVEEIIEALETATSLFGRIPLPFSEWLLKLPIPSTVNFYKAKKRLNETVNRLIDGHKKTKDKKTGLLSMLLDANVKDKEGRMSDQQLRDEVITLFLTAFDTTSTALTWTWYLLSQNPAAEAELHEELDRVLNGKLPTFEDFNQLKFTRMVFGESMRIYPPSYVIPRQSISEFKLDKYIIPGGTIILMSPYLIHHDPRFHSNPERFDPHEWDKSSRGRNSKYEYFPFSKGPRSCIGEPFAWMQGVMVLASIAQSWRPKLMPGHKVELLPRINLRPKNGMNMTVHRRKRTS
jgi:cytochrome P450